MKKLNVKKEILLIVLIFVAILTICSKVFATGTTINPIHLDPTSTNTNSIDTNQINNTVSTTPVPTTPVPTTTLPVANNTIAQNTTLPQTGDASDYAIFFIIIVAAIMAIFAFKKVKDYRI